MSAYLAVDAGNSKTVALVVDGEGTVLGRGRGGRGDIYGAKEIPEALAAVFGAVHGALASAGITAADIAWAAFRLAGVDWREDAEFWDGHIRARLGAMGGWSIKNDGFAALRLIDGRGVGVSVCVGTGPAIAARSPEGREAYSGMFVFDDLGGAGLGNSGIEAVYREWMGIGPATALTPALLKFYGVDDAAELRHRFTRRFGAWPETDRWRVSRLVLSVAGDGDPVAAGIVDRQASAFTQYAGWAARRVGCPLETGELPVLLNGSVATSEHPAMRDALSAQIALVSPATRVLVSEASPLTGIVLDALAEGGVPVTPDLLARVTASDHPAAFLAT